MMVLVVEAASQEVVEEEVDLVGDLVVEIEGVEVETEEEIEEVPVVVVVVPVVVVEV